MKQLITYFTAALVLISCGRKQRKDITAALPSTPIVNELTTGDPIDFYNDKMLVFPVGGMHYENAPVEPKQEVKVLKGSTKGTFFNVTAVSNLFYDAGTTYEYRVADENNQEVKNLIFYNKFTKEKYLLSDSALHILAFSVHKEFKPHLIMFEIIKNDFNKDTLYNSNDPKILYISKTDGKEFIQLSPDNEMYLDYFFYPETNMLLVKSLMDSNKDGIFSTGEETRFTEVDLNKPALGNDIFADEFKNVLKSMVK